MEHKKKFRFGIVITLLIIAALFVPAISRVDANVGVKTATDYQLMKQTVKKHYGNKPIKIVDGNGSEKKYWKTILRRKNKNYIVVEKVVSYGNGTKHGWYTTSDGNTYIIAYNKKAAKGKQVASYIIWNPYTNYEDDITFVIDNGKVR